MTRDPEEAASSSVISFMVAGVLFVASIAAVITTTQQGATGASASQVPQANLRAQAESLSKVLVLSPGYTRTEGDWAAFGVDFAGATPLAEEVSRLGLKEAASGDDLLMSFAKFQNLRRAPFAPANDGYVNYPEARAGFGLDAVGLDFHVRAYPTFPEVAELLRKGYRDPNLRITYIGDIAATRNGGGGATDPAAGLTVTPPTCVASPAMGWGAYRLSVTATNGGTTTTQFSALFTYALNGTQALSQNANGPVVGPGQSVTLSVDVPASTASGRVRSCAAGSTVVVDVQDPGRAVVQVATTIPAAGAVQSQPAAARDLWVDTSKPYYVNPTGATSACEDPVKLYYSGVDLVRNEWLRVRVANAGGTQFNASFQVEHQPNQRTIPGARGAAPVWSGCLPTGQYTATLWYCGATSCPGAAGTPRVQETIVVTATAPSPYQPPEAEVGDEGVEYTPSASASKETDFIQTLVDNFCPTYFDRKGGTPLPPTADWDAPWETRCEPFKADPLRPGQTLLDQPGDVFPDVKNVLNNDLPKRLVADPRDCDANPRYDVTNVIIAGTNMDQTAMTSAQAKHCLATWVMGGGYLIVFGSEAQNVNWLEPIFHAAIRSSSGGLATPDLGHPVLNTADVLDHPDYDNQDRVWSFNGQTAQNAETLFTNVVLQGTDPVMTVSNPGAMGGGTVSLTTWMPADVYGGGMPAETAHFEGLKLVNNLLMQGYRDLYLDYGPPLPTETNVEPAISRVHIKHPQFPDPILLSVALYVFPGATS